MSFTPPSDQEVGTIDTLKKQMFAEYPDLRTKPFFTNTTVLRFFRGHKGKAAAAFEGLKKYIQWRIEEDVDTIDNRKAEFQREIDAKKAVLGFRDLNGRPAAYVYAHNHNAHDRNIDEVHKLTIWVLESLRKAANPVDERFVIGVDMSKFTLRCMDYEAVKLQIHILQSCYPDTLDSCYVVDSPTIFWACWSIIRPWMDPVTANKVQFIGKADVSKYFDVATIPSDK